MPHLQSYYRTPETVILFSTFQRRHVALESLASLLRATEEYDVVVVVSDSTPVKDFDLQLIELGPDEAIWAPGDVSAATSRNIAVELIADKYAPRWLLFVEDDVLYHDGWYLDLISTAQSLDGKRSPLGLCYGYFSASLEAIGAGQDGVAYDETHDVYASQLGLRADQRLYSSAHYFSVVRNWDPDLLGISSAQTGKMIHRSLMRGFCGGSIGHRGLCSFVPGQESTHVGLREIGPAAFDKRLEGYRGIVEIAERNFHAGYREHASMGNTSESGVFQSPSGSDIRPSHRPIGKVPYGVQNSSVFWISSFFRRAVRKVRRS